MEDGFNDISGIFPDAERSAGGIRSPLERIRAHAETALRLTKSARTINDVPRYLQRVIDGITVELALNPPNGAQPDFEALANRFMAWPIPASLVSDRCMSEPNYKFPRMGTCIMGPYEARQMLEYLFNPQP